MRSLLLHSSISSSFVAVCLLASAGGCSSSSSPAASTDAGGDATTNETSITPDAAGETHGETGAAEGGGDVSGDTAPPPSLLEIPCTDTMDAVYGAPGDLTKDKGTVLKCAFDRYVTATALAAEAQALGYVGGGLTSGAYIYRVQYRTERGDPASSPGYSTAIVYLPDTPIAASAPLIAASHGTAGEGASCLVSKDGDDPDGDPNSQVKPLAGAGYPLIFSDYAGLSNYGAAGNPPSGYLVANDAAKSVLDSVHALRTMMPSHASQKVLVTGHSQGGHTALNALALYGTYGLDGTLAGVILYSPIWFNNESWGGLMALGNADPYEIKTSGGLTAFAIYYFYSRAELTDGPGHGIDVFAKSKQASIKSFFDGTCYRDDTATVLSAYGTYIDDLFDPDFITGIGSPAGFGVPCTDDGSAAAAFCDKWLPRLKAERPHITGAATKIPILYLYGGNDQTITPDRSTCGLDRLTEDGAAVQTCIIPLAAHYGPMGITRLGVPYALKWASAQTLGTADPGPCPLTFTITSGASSFQPENDAGVPDPDAGAPITCATLPANDGDK